MGTTTSEYQLAGNLARISSLSSGADNKPRHGQEGLECAWAAIILSNKPSGMMRAQSNNGWVLLTLRVPANKAAECYEAEIAGIPATRMPRPPHTSKLLGVSRRICKVVPNVTLGFWLAPREKQQRSPGQRSSRRPGVGKERCSPRNFEILVLSPV